jgi:hypothetical protein
MQNLVNYSSWTLNDSEILRTSRKKEVRSYFFHDIDAIRLSYYTGSRGHPSQFVCSFSVNGVWSIKQRIHWNFTKLDSQDARDYHQFVMEFIRRTKQRCSVVRLFAGYSRFIWWFYMGTVGVCLSIPVMIVGGNFGSANDALLIAGGLLLLCSPLIIGMIKHYPRELKWGEVIPKKVLPGGPVAYFW